MYRRCITVIAALALLISLAGTGAASAETSPPGTRPVIQLASLEWPPFSSQALDRGGATTAVVAAAMQIAGFELQVSFFPWQRAVETGLKRPGMFGYFPEYFSSDLATRQCAYSRPVGSSPLGFVYSTNAPVDWKDLTDLQGRLIGTVQAYVNTEAFDRLAAAGVLKVEPVSDDATNLRKVAAGRLPLAVIDRNVLNFLVNSRPELAAVRHRLTFHPRILEDKLLYVCFRPDAAGLALRDRFDAALATLNIDALQSEVLHSLNN